MTVGFLRCAALLLALVAGTAGAAGLPNLIEQELPQARLGGQGSFTWFGLDVYQAQLWVGAQGYRSAQPEAAPFALDLRYARALGGKKIAQASVDQMEQLQAGTSAQRQEWLSWMNASFPDVQVGTHLSALFLPGAGLRFYLNGKLLAATSDRAFARAFCAIWLDPATSAGSLRTALLRDAAPLP